MPDTSPANKPTTQVATSVLVKRLWQDHIRHYKGWLFLAILAMAVVAAATAFSAWLMEPVVNEVFIAKNRSLLWPIGGAVMATFLIKGLANYAQTTLISFVGLRIIADAQKRLYNHLIAMDIQFFHNNPTGTLVSRFTNDINSMRVAVSNALTAFGKDMLSLIGLVTVMILKDWMLAVMALTVFPIAIYPIVRLGRRMRKVTANTQTEQGLFMALLNQTFQGIRLVKAYGMQDYEKKRVTTLVERIFALVMKATKTRAMSSPIMETLGGTSVAIVIVYGGFRVIDGATTSGAFFAFITALLLAYEPMKRLANLNVALQQGLAGAERLYQMLDSQAQIIDQPAAKILDRVKGDINIQNVTFSYGADRSALTDISLNIPAGKTVALVGPSGGGKSTILNLIPRFYDVDDGQVMIDDQNIQNVTMASLHANIALVSQEIMLFDDTIRANIAYGRQGASDDDIEQAAKLAAADGFIQTLPNGYDTMVGEQGIRLSGGQRQRLAIARAMLKNAPILLLDEATSALDTESERKVQAALETLMEGRTTLIIAHRLSTVVDADMIYVIDQGRVIELGNHQELLDRGQVYRHLYDLQFARDPI